MREEKLDRSQSKVFLVSLVLCSKLLYILEYLIALLCYFDLFFAC